MAEKYTFQNFYQTIKLIIAICRLAKFVICELPVTGFNLYSTLTLFILIVEIIILVIECQKERQHK